MSIDAAAENWFIIEVMMQMQSKQLLYLAIAIIIIGVGIYIWSLRQNQTSTPLTWETCIKLPGSVIEQSYPARCVTPDGRSVLQPITSDSATTQPSSSAAPSPDYYGSSTFAACTSDTECVVAGCNSEICQGQGEEVRVSICIFPDKPTFKQMGFTCRCYASKCQWYK